MSAMYLRREINPFTIFKGLAIFNPFTPIREVVVNEEPKGVLLQSC